MLLMKGHKLSVANSLYKTICRSRDGSIDKIMVASITPYAKNVFIECSIGKRYTKIISLLSEHLKFSISSSVIKETDEDTLLSDKNIFIFKSNFNNSCGNLSDILSELVWVYEFFERIDMLNAFLSYGIGIKIRISIDECNVQVGKYKFSDIPYKYTEFLHLLGVSIRTEFNEEILKYEPVNISDKNSLMIHRINKFTNIQFILSGDNSSLINEIDTYGFYEISILFYKFLSEEEFYLLSKEVKDVIALDKNYNSEYGFLDYLYFLPQVMDILRQLNPDTTIEIELSYRVSDDSPMKTISIYSFSKDIDMYELFLNTA